MDVTTFGTADGTSGGSNQKLKRAPMRVRLLPYISDFLQSVGCPKPELLSCEFVSGKYIVEIAFKGTELKRPTKRGRVAQVCILRGEDLDPTTAENNAAACLVNYLNETHGIFVNDISRRKIHQLAPRIQECAPVIYALTRKFNMYMGVLNRATDLLKNFWLDSITGNRRVWREGIYRAREVWTSNRTTINQLAVTASSFECTLRPRSVYRPRIADIATTEGLSLVFNVPMKQMLHDMLSSKNLKIPEYATTEDADGTFVCKCKIISVGDPAAPHIETEGRGLSPAEADCNAAADAILHLEKFFNEEVHDFGQYGYRCAAEFLDNHSAFQDFFNRAKSQWMNFIGELESLACASREVEDSMVIGDFAKRAKFAKSLEALLADVIALHQEALALVGAV